MCEKPFIIDDKKVDDILYLSRKNKKLIFETFMYVYHPAFIKLKKLIKNSNFGKIEYVVSNFKFPSLNSNNQRYKKNKTVFFMIQPYILYLLKIIYLKTLKKRKMCFIQKKLEKKLI